MSQTLAFDVYGTLIDTTGVFKNLQDIVGDRARSLMKRWRDKQLEYSFRRGLMNLHVDFFICTRQALEFCCNSMNIDLTEDQINTLMKAYTSLPAFPDVEQALTECRKDGHNVYAFSNGSLKAVQHLLEQAGLSTLFDGMISTEDVKMFKPSPVVYKHFLDATGTKKQSAWLISGNTFDVIGALSFGMHAVWVRRSADAVFDPWEYPPTATISGLTGLYGILN